MVKLIHASDVHLGITYAGIGKNHREIARELKQAAFDAFEKVVGKAIEEEVDALVLSGDLLDSQRTFIKEKLFLQQQLNRLAPFGIPDLMSEIRSGDIVELDGDKGYCKVIRESKIE